MEQIICLRCNQDKATNDFYYRSNGSRILPCKLCIKANNANYYVDNKATISERKIAHYNENKEEILVKVKSYQESNAEKISAQKKVYYQANREEIISKQVKYRAKSLRQYYQNYKNNPEYKIRKRLSFSIARTLKKNGGSKNGNSILKFLPYSIQELKEHLETQFEPWMTWDNWGNYSKETWDDNDISTWTWQIDHVIPHSDFQYSSMEDEEFKKCWSLENLRPLSSKTNNFDGVNKIRHKGIK